MIAIQQNDYKAFEILYSRYRIPVFSYLKGLIASDIAEELMQETFIKVLNKSSSFRFESKVKTWIWTIAKNTLHDHWRSTDHRMGSHFEVLTDPESGEELYQSSMDSLEEAYLKSLTKKHLETCINELPTEQKEIVFLHIHSELSHQEISTITGNSVGAIKSILFRCKEKLTACFKAKRQL